MSELRDSAHRYGFTASMSTLTTRLGIWLLAGMAAVAVVAIAVSVAAAVGTPIFTKTESGRGANMAATIGLGKHYTAYTFTITTQPAGLPIHVDWATRLPMNPALDTHSPFRHSVRCSHPCVLDVSARLGLVSRNPPKSATGRLTLTVSVP
jgi:hypothetical protein